jgi:TBC1 domain family member 5
MEFFQHKEVAKLLNTILFVWCKLNPDVSYKQGMNELLASVVVCYFQEVEFKTLADRPEGVSEE